ncbi:unnamed protein product [Dovyalis caffra]|uniref:Uncharacterized protein n=1 Tax=Dovyalis caffra TaxID=77055 RepID=A0AAV1SDE3_9ROSI|nr:unnamed protein product [Dovyalis caffra]
MLICLVGSLTSNKDLPVWILKAKARHPVVLLKKTKNKVRIFLVFDFEVYGDRWISLWYCELSNEEERFLPMMVKLCMMASHGYPSASAVVFHQGQKRVIKFHACFEVLVYPLRAVLRSRAVGSRDIKPLLSGHLQTLSSLQPLHTIFFLRKNADCQPYLPSQGARQEMTRSNSLMLKLHQHEEPWRPMNRFCEFHFAEIDSTVKTPTLIDVQDARPDSVLFSFGIVEKCTRQEKILQFLMSESNKLETDGLDLSLLSELMGLQAVMFDVQQQSHSPLIYPSGQLDAPKSLVDFVGDMARSSKLTVLPDGRVLLTGNGTEMKDILATVAEFYLSKNSTMWRKQPMLVPEFSRFDTSEVDGNSTESSFKVRDMTVATLKRLRFVWRVLDCSKTAGSPMKIKPSRKKKNARKGGRERDLYKRNYFHACESLLSLMMNKQHGKTAVLSLKKSGPELPELLNQFSVGIAGTGLALLFSVICRVACGRVTFCASKLFSTGIGFGLVWLSWAVNQLKDTVVYISKHASKVGLKDEEIISSVDKSFREIYLRAATVMAVAVLRLV